MPDTRVDRVDIKKFNNPTKNLKKYKNFIYIFEKKNTLTDSINFFRNNPYSRKHHISEELLRLVKLFF